MTENEIWFAKGDLIGAKKGPWGRIPSHVPGDLEIDIHPEDNFVKTEAEVGILLCEGEQESQPPPEARGRAWDDYSLQVLEGTCPAGGALTPDFHL